MAISHRQLKALMSDIDGIYGLATRNAFAGNCRIAAILVQIDQPPTTSG
jgi:hypothetical protein